MMMSSSTRGSTRSDRFAGVADGSSCTFIINSATRCAQSPLPSTYIRRRAQPEFVPVQHVEHPTRGMRPNSSWKWTSAQATLYKQVGSLATARSLKQRSRHIVTTSSSYGNNYTDNVNGLRTALTEQRGVPRCRARIVSRCHRRPAARGRGVSVATRRAIVTRTCTRALSHRRVARGTKTRW